MGGTPSNANVWAEGEVFIGDVDTASTPVDISGAPSGAPYDNKWDEVGLLSGSDGFTEQIGVSSNDFFAWGGILVASSKSELKITRTFSAYEDNETVLELRYPGSSLTFNQGTITGDLAVADLQRKFKVGFQTITSGVMKRVTSAGHAQVDSWGDLVENEDGIMTYPFTVAIYPDLSSGKPVYWHLYKGPVGLSS